MVLLQCIKGTADTNFNSLRFIQDLGPVIISAIALLVTYLVTKKTLNAQKDGEARLLIRKKLDEFYGPLLQLRKKSSLLYDKFSDKFKKENKEFATITYLLSGNRFTGNDKVLIEEIIAIGRECESLIHSKAGLIDDTELRLNLIPRATTHFLLLRLAYDGLIVGEAEKYKDLTFPHELDEKLEIRKKQLERDLANLNSN